MERKTIYIMCGSVIGIFLVLLLVIWIMSLTRSHTYDYPEVEAMIVDATEKYYRDNPIYLPTDDGTYNLAFTALVSDGYIKPLGELIEGGDVCSANITVVKKNDTFTYIPQLNCGEKYSTISLADHIISNNPVVTEGKGLYKDENGEYFFRGKVENNYVALGKYTKNKNELYYLWKIIGIENGKVKLIAVDDLKYKTVWDNRYNSTENKYVGYNDFDLSIIAEYLKKLESNTENRLSYEDLAKIEPTNLCVGPRKFEESIASGRVECSKLSKEKYLFGTISPYDYMRASLDPECTVSTSYTCTNLNYLAESNNGSVWTVIPSIESNFEVFTFNDGYFEINSAKSNKKIFPVIYLNEYTFFKSGIGTLEDPYMIK